MTIKRRVKKLETGGAGSSGLEGLPERLMGTDRESVALRQKLDAMTAAELVELAFDTTGDNRERREALQRLQDSGIEKTRLIDARIQIEEAGIKQMKACAGELIGQDRELNQRMIMAIERIVERLRDEKTEIN